MTRTVTKTTHAGYRQRAGLRAFSLMELIVVVAIIALVAAMAIPAMKPMLASNKAAASIDMLDSLLAGVVTDAMGSNDAVALRFERALKTDSRTGRVVDAQGLFIDDSGFNGPIRLDYQQVRKVSRRMTTFVWDVNDRVQPFHSSVGVAPSYILAWPDLTNAGLNVEVNVNPTFPNSMKLYWNVMDNFYVIFGGEGLMRYTAAIGYEDLPWTVRPNNAMPYAPVIWYQQMDIDDDGDIENVPSARSILLYDRQKFLALPDNHDVRLAFLKREAKVCHINRVTGAIVEDLP